MKNRIFLICILLLVGGCAFLPPNTADPTYVFQDTADTRIGNGYRELKKNHSEESGIFLASLLPVESQL